MAYGAGRSSWASRADARRSRVIAPVTLPRWTWVMPTASWARPCHSIRSSSGPFFHAASSTSCALNAKPRSSRSWAYARVSAGGSARSSGMRATPSLPCRRGRPRASRGRVLRGRPDSSRSRSAMCPSWQVNRDPHTALTVTPPAKVVMMFPTANARPHRQRSHLPSVTVLRRSELVIRLGELGRIVGLVVIVTGGLPADLKRLRMLFRLIQLLDDLAPHRLGHGRLDRCADRGHLDLHHQQLMVVVPGVNQRLQPARRHNAGVHIDLAVRVDQGLITFHHDGFEECQR